MISMVMKLVTKANSAGHCFKSPSSSDELASKGSDKGSLRFKTNSVIANAKIPSLNASVLAVSRSSKLSRLMVSPERLSLWGYVET